MNKIIVTDQIGKEYLNETTEMDPSESFKILKYVHDAIAEKAKELFGGELYDLGITEMAETGGSCCSEADIEGVTAVATSSHSAILGGQNKTHNGSVKIVKDGEIVDTGVNLRIHAYPSGLAISLGKTGTNFLGSTFDLYLTKMTSKNMKSGSLGYARLFKSWKDVKKFLEKYTSEMLYVAGNTTAVFGVKVVGDGVAEDPKAKDAVAELLNLINGYPKDLEDHTEIPETVDADGILKEAVHRMNELRLYDGIVAEYRKCGKLFMSENYGTLYDLDEEAKKAVERIRERGLVPYHVIKSRLMTGTVYDVLYVSDNTEDWTYERPTSDGYVNSWCWMECYQDSEIGDIKVEKIAGGLRRVA